MERRLRRRKFLYAEEQYQLLLREQRNNVEGRNMFKMVFGHFVEWMCRSSFREMKVPSRNTSVSYVELN
ncbi:hypothetical protein T07_8065 [Trichinella nelsoni]|uniref:Uncharacterized protein n=1 Tax=Trichinella nelsoni TaxID=6336 RepID=A0A0V0RUV2_9BILA|nr:hypothetical protein T07_8065 [Trichinella nelsoni]